MKARLLACAAAGLAGAGLAGAVPFAAGAQVPGGAPVYAQPYRAATAQDQILANVRAAGLAPLSRPALRGAVFYVRAMSRNNVEVRVAVDARTGRVLAATRVADAPRYEPAIRGQGYSEAAPLPPGEVPLAGRAVIDPIPPAPARAAAPVQKKFAAQPPARPAGGGSADEVTGSIPQAPATTTAPVSKPMEASLAPMPIAKPADAKPADVKPADAKSADAKSADAKSADPGSAATMPVPAAAATSAAKPAAPGAGATASIAAKPPAATAPSAPQPVTMVPIAPLE